MSNVKLKKGSLYTVVGVYSDNQDEEYTYDYKPHQKSDVYVIESDGFMYEIRGDVRQEEFHWNIVVTYVENYLVDYTGHKLDYIPKVDSPTYKLNQTISSCFTIENDYFTSSYNGGDPYYPDGEKFFNPDLFTCINE